MSPSLMTSSLEFSTLDDGGNMRRWPETGTERVAAQPPVPARRRSQQVDVALDAVGHHEEVATMMVTLQVILVILIMFSKGH